MNNLQTVSRNDKDHKYFGWLICINFLLLSCMFSNGIGFFTPLCNDLLEITVIDIHREDVIKTFTDTEESPEGTAILVVDTSIKVLNDITLADLDVGAIYLMNEQEEILSDLKGFGGIGSGAIVVDRQICYEGCHLVLEEGRDYYLGFIFFVEENDVNQKLVFLFPDIEPVVVTLE